LVNHDKELKERCRYCHAGFFIQILFFFFLLYFLWNWEEGFIELIFILTDCTPPFSGLGTGCEQDI
jgi:hypothetical protein